MIKVWGRKTSSNAQAVMWCIEELELQYERIDAGLTYGVVNSDEYRSMNPNGTVPTIQDGSHPALFESGAIIRYLAHTYGSDSFWPADPLLRANVDQWAEWSKLNIALKFTAPIFWQVVRIRPENQNPALIQTGIEKFEMNLAIAEKQLANQNYLTGEHFTAADIQFGHVLFRYYDLPIERANLPNVQNYYARIAERDAFQQHVIVDYEELRGNL